MRDSIHFKVCTRCFTFNQEGIIEDALNGFVRQKTSFPVVYAVVDDASTDKTADVIRAFLESGFDGESPLS